MRNFFTLITVFAILLSANAIAVSFILSDQGTDVKSKATGDPINGSLLVTIYDSPTGGNLLYNETFSSGMTGFKCAHCETAWRFDPTRHGEESRLLLVSLETHIRRRNCKHTELILVKCMLPLGLPEFNKK